MGGLGVIANILTASLLFLLRITNPQHAMNRRAPTDSVA